MRKKTLFSFFERHKLKVIYVLSVITHFLVTLYRLAPVYDWMLVQALVGFIIPFIGLLTTHWVIEAKGLKERLQITAVTALGLSTGSTLLLLFLRFFRSL